MLLGVAFHGVALPGGLLVRSPNEASNTVRGGKSSEAFEFLNYKEDSDSNIKLLSCSCG
jgi:hypothetical protein